MINVPSFHTNSATLKELVKDLKHGNNSFLTFLNIERVKRENSENPIAISSSHIFHIYPKILRALHSVPINELMI